MDEAYLSAIGNRTNQHQAKKLYIFNHFSEKLIQEKGLHFENHSGYPKCKLVFYDLHDME
jgi:hypothetical protein